MEGHILRALFTLANSVAVMLPIVFVCQRGGA